MTGTGGVGDPLVHTNTASAGNAGQLEPAQQDGAVVIDLGAVYEIDALQVWNFNLTGNDGSGTPYVNYGPTSFTLSAIASGDTLPPTWPASAEVKDAAGQPLTLSLATAPGTAGYKGETYLFNGASQPGDVADRDGTGEAVTSETPVVGRYLLLGNLTGTAAGGGHVGLSEVRVYGRALGDPNVVFIGGDGIADQTMDFRGSVSALNNALAGLTYTPNADYNTGDVNFSEALVVHLDDVVGGVTHTGASSRHRQCRRRRITR